MFEKFITSLKQSLPEPLRKKLGIGDENIHDQEQPEEESVETQGTSGEPENAAADKKKKQISMLIRVVVVIALGYLAVDHFFLSENPQSEIANIPTKPRKKRIRPPKDNKPVDVKAAAEVKPGEKVADASTVAPVEKAAEKPADKPADKPAEMAEVKPEEKNESKPKEIIPPVENINIAEKKTEEPTAPKDQETPIDETPILKTPVVQAPKMGEAKSSEQVDKSLDSLIDSVDAKDNKTDESLSKKDTKLEDKIVADDVYTEPPVYDQVGRGLVYNCKEKHWACVDKLSYVSCNKNMKWNKSHAKPAECAILNVYNSDDDCGIVQKYNISTSKPTPFCQ